jgi:hypothetical protein
MKANKPESLFYVRLQLYKMEKEKEKAIIELLNQKKPYSENQQQLHVSSRYIAHTKKKNEEQQKKVEEEQNKVQISN